MGGIFLRVSCAGLGLAVGGCQAERDLPAASHAVFDPIALLSGRSEGKGHLKPLLGSAVAVAVQSRGLRRGETLVLDQIIKQGSKPPRVRRWTMLPAGPGRYSGTLTDASGPVQVDVTGPRARIRYRMTNGLEIDQRLALQSDGRTVLNRLEVRKLGLRVAVLNETIRKLEP